MYQAIQKGFEKSTGEIMAWINSDDKYHAGALYTVAQIFSEIKDIEWILGMPSIYNKDGFCVKVNNDRRWSKSRIYTGDYRWIQQESVFWKLPFGKNPVVMLIQTSNTQPILNCGTGFLIMHNSIMLRLS